MRVRVRNWVARGLLSLLSVVSLAAVNDLRMVEAVKHHDKEAMRALLKQRVDVNTPEPDGSTALHWAAQWDDSEAVDILIHAGARVNVATDYGITPLWIACKVGSAAMVETLLKAGASPNAARVTGETALMRAALTGNQDVVNALLARGADVNAAEAGGQTALMWAISAKYLPVAQALMAHGANIRARSKPLGFTPLLFAARQGDLDAVRLLLSAGADLNEAASDGSNVLLVATVRGHKALASFLLDQGANPNADAAGYTPLHWVAGTWETVLTREMMNIPAESGEWSAEWRRLRGLQGQAQIELLKTLLAHGANVNARTTKEPPRFGHTFAGQIPNLAGATPFFLAAMAADTGVMRVLLAHGADARLATNANTTPLMAAVGCCIRSTSESAITESSALEAGKLLVENLGADVNAVNANGETALHGTAYLGYDTIAQYLVDKGAKLNVKNKNGWTPVAVADGVIFQQATQVHKSTADLLRKLGGTN